MVAAEIFGLHVEVQSHADSFVVTDKWGNRRGIFNWKNEVELKKLNEMIKLALSEQEAADYVPPEQDQTRPVDLDDDGLID